MEASVPRSKERSRLPSPGKPNPPKACPFQCRLDAIEQAPPNDTTRNHPPMVGRCLTVREIHATPSGLVCY